MVEKYGKSNKTGQFYFVLFNVINAILYGSVLAMQKEISKVFAVYIAIKMIILQSHTDFPFHEYARIFFT